MAHLRAVNSLNVIHESVNSVNFVADRLDDVVLVEIFLNLDHEDLVNCEKVCERWHRILKICAWKTWFNEKVIIMNDYNVCRARVKLIFFN